MNTGTARIVIVLALIATGAAVLLNGFTDEGGAVAAPGGDGGNDAVTPSDSPSPTTTKTSKPPEETPSPAAPKDTVFAVFNGTSTVGLASTVEDDLKADGYEAGQVAANAPTSGITDSVVYYVGGADAAQDESNATEIRNSYFDGARVRELDPDYADLIENDVQVVIVVGDDYQP